MTKSAKPTAITIRRLNGESFTVSVGDMVTIETLGSTFTDEPSELRPVRVDAIGGGQARSWLRAGGYDWDPWGQRRGLRDNLRRLRAYDADAVLRNERELAAHRERRDLGFALNYLDWRKELQKPGVLEKAKELLAAVRAEVQS